MNALRIGLTIPHCETVKGKGFRWFVNPVNYNLDKKAAELEILREEEPEVHALILAAKAKVVAFSVTWLTRRLYFKASRTFTIRKLVKTIAGIIKLPETGIRLLFNGMPVSEADIIENAVGYGGMLEMMVEEEA